MRVSPKDCAILVGVPLEHDGPEGGASALPSSSESLLRMSKQNSDHLRQILIDVRHLGAFVPEPIPTDLDAVRIAAREYPVLVVVTHHAPEAGFQFGDRFAKQRDLISALGTFSGTLDVGVCESTDVFLPPFHASLPNAQCVSYRELLRVRTRASILRAVFRILAARPRPYVEAVADVLEEFILRAKEHRT